MRNAIRRSRNIGTVKQSHGQHNRLTIPQQRTGSNFYECLGKITRHEIVVNGHSFLILVEPLSAGYQHCCSVADVVQMLTHIPSRHYGELQLIVLRQPKRKEAILTPVWGRLIYFYEFEDYFGPAVILEAVKPGELLRWRRSLSMDDQQELQRLAADGHRVEQTARHHRIELHPASARATQLYRTLLHEFGHYQHYREYCDQPDAPSEDTELLGAGSASTRYSHLPASEKEHYAHAYAARLHQQLAAAGLIPFAPLP